LWCTGGLVAKRVTDVAGSSRYFERGFVTYSNGAKVDLLGVDPKAIEAHGAVSELVASQMAAGARKKAGADVGIGVTGIAGPDGGTPTKPVGTVFVGLLLEGEVTARRFQFLGDRAAVKWQSTQAALDMLRRSLRA